MILLCWIGCFGRLAGSEGEPGRAGEESRSRSVPSRRPPPLPRRHRTGVCPQAPPGRPRLVLEVAQYCFVPCVPLVPPGEPGAHDLAVQVPAIRQDDLGHGAPVAVHVPDMNGHYLAECEVARLVIELT